MVRVAINPIKVESAIAKIQRNEKKKFYPCAPCGLIWHYTKGVKSSPRCIVLLLTSLTPTLITCTINQNLPHFLVKYIVKSLCISIPFLYNT